MINERLEAYTVIKKVLRNNEFSDNLLNSSVKKIRKQNGDSNLFYTLVKGVIKMKGNLEYILSTLTDSDKFAQTDLKIKVWLYIGLFQIIHLDSIPEYAAVNETVELAKKSLSPKTAAFINAVLRNYLRNKDIKYPEDAVGRIAAEQSYPKEIIEQWIEIYGEEDAEYLALHFNDIPRLHLRVNKTATTSAKIQAYFKNKHELDFRTSDLSDSMLVTDSATTVIQDVTFDEGYYSIQDTAAAGIVELLDPKPGESILDMFAAPGGKATFICEKLNNTGEVIAIDKKPSKVKMIKQAAERLQLSNIIPVVTDALKYGPKAPAYDRVLLDVPCSGWGVFGRKAELRWQVHQNLNEILKLQAKALDYCSGFVKKGGYLVYSTCTLNPRENQDQIKRFLESHKQFKLIPASDFVPKKYTSEEFYLTKPHIHNIDGAFAAKMQKM
ncbi:MAG: 16S rRNA (cytosine(967)-C(5))-methyltransferase RsmB [Candidatus Zophobacter franzmannii]|nr:16S rRNA (cytosine(967)-C(5))-methyltransferase RsmB [Candidatus Zophobacter franzmannii]